MVCDAFGEASEEMFGDGCEDMGDGLGVELVGVHHVELPDYSGSDMGPPSSRLPQSSQQQDILNLHELLVLPVVPPIMVHKLSQQFNRWLGLVLLFLGHVEIINKNDVLLANWGSIDSSLDLLKFEINGVLSLVD